jgi:hypothetical protein
MSRKFGKIAQIGYVVRDIDAAMDNWIEHGVGPWFYFDRVQTDYFRYRGADSAMEMSVALANSGDIQIELIQQRNDAPSMYKDFLDSGREGMQHIAYWSNDFQKLYDDAVGAPSTNRAPSSRSPISAVPKANSSSTSARSPRTGTAAIRSAGGIESHGIPCLPRHRRIAPAPQGHSRHARPGQRLQDGHALTRSGAGVLRDGRRDFPRQFATAAICENWQSCGSDTAMTPTTRSTNTRSSRDTPVCPPKP